MIYVIPKDISKYLKSKRQNTPIEIIVDRNNRNNNMIVRVFNFSMREVYKIAANICWRWKDLEKNLEICIYLK